MHCLLDECLPTQLRFLFPDHSVHSAQWAGLCGIQNGDLLQAAENRYEVLITIDQNMRHQNKVAKFKLGVIVIVAESNSMEHLTPKIDAIKDALKRIKPGQVIVVGETESES